MGGWVAARAASTPRSSDHHPSPITPPCPPPAVPHQQTGVHGNPVTVELNKVSSLRMSVGWEQRRTYTASGSALSYALERQLDGWESDFTALVTGASANQSLGDVAAQLAELRRLSGSNLAALRARLGVRIEVPYAASLSQLSALYYDNATSFGGVDDIVLGGYSALTDALAAQLGPSRLRFRTPVAAISHGDSNATVVLAGGGTLRAQYVVSTLPLGVLQAGDVHHDPAFPTEALSALSRLGVGHMSKVVLWFDEVSGGGMEVVGARWWDGQAAGRELWATVHTPAAHPCALPPPHCPLPATDFLGRQQVRARPWRRPL